MTEKIHPNARPPLISDTLYPETNSTNRRNFLGNMALGMGALGASSITAKANASLPVSFDSMDPESNLKTLLKLQADLAEKEVISAFEGKAWMWVPGEANYLAFQTFGIGASMLKANENGTWNFHHREILYYMDPKTGKILDRWTNPVTGRTVEVLHILNDPVNRVYRLKGGFIEPPYPHVVVGDRIVFQLDVFRAEENPISREEYPLHSQQSVYQSCELWAISGSVKEVANSDITSANNHTAWARNGMWLPFMEMGNRLGHMVYHSQSFKLMDGISQLPKYIREYTEKNYPKYLEAPKVWNGMKNNENSWSYSKKIIDEKRKSGRGGATGKGSVFGLNN